MEARYPEPAKSWKPFPVGRKTANVVLNVAFGQPTMAVDTHIFRVGNRTGLAPARIRWKSRSSCSSAYPTNTRWTPITG
jgi:endonuclease III